MSKYIEFELVAQKPKTAIYAVRNIASKEILGYIQWYGPWRRYCLFTEPACVWSKDCLDTITKFIQEKQNEYINRSKKQ